MFRRMLFLLAALAVLPMNLIQAQGVLLPPDVRFENGPKVGEMVPDVTIVDDQGRPVSVRDLTQGQYTVMTLGCLT